MAISAWFTDSASRERGYYQNNWKVTLQMSRCRGRTSVFQFVPGLASVLDDQCRMEDFLEKEVRGEGAGGTWRWRWSWRMWRRRQR